MNPKVRCATRRCIVDDLVNFSQIPKIGQFTVGGTVHTGPSSIGVRCTQTAGSSSNQLGLSWAHSYDLDKHN
jgi:hypothetical protein